MSLKVEEDDDGDLLLSDPAAADDVAAADDEDAAGDDEEDEEEDEDVEDEGEDDEEDLHEDEDLDEDYDFDSEEYDMSDDGGLLDDDDGSDALMGSMMGDGGGGGAGAGLHRSHSYESLSEAVLEETSGKLVKAVMETCAVPSEAAASVLLRHFKWNKERLIDKMMDDREATLSAVGLTDAFDLEEVLDSPGAAAAGSTTTAAAAAAAAAGGGGGEEATFECMICLDEVPFSETFALSCGHRYCTDCYGGHLRTSIKDGAKSVYTFCPGRDCKVIVHEGAFKKLVTEQEYERYRIFLRRSYVDDNDHVKWCPFAGCGAAVRVERTNRVQPVHCDTCTNDWCFKCADADKGDHSPVGCESLDAWIAKGEDESENVKWMIANTKKCPKCRSPIEKNGGCMHMTCPTASCRYDFCWMCRGPWSEHGAATGGYYSCNKYDASKAKDEDAAASQVKTELDHYMFYFHRYEAHQKAGKMAIRQRRKLDQRENEMLRRFEVRSQDCKFVSEAADQLINNRRVLMYSYVMGFFLTKKDNKQLYEYLQEDLEKYTSHLSDLFERPLDDIPNYAAFQAYKEEMTNYTRVTRKYLEGFIEGATENSWG